MIEITSRKFDAPEEHHIGWFRVFRFRRHVELWFGKRWIGVSW